jgi:zinc protease
VSRWLPRFALAGFAWLGVIGAAHADVERVVSPKGIEAWLIEDHSNPLISVAIGFQGGAALDPAGKEGLSYLASGLMDEGAGDLDSAAFQKKLADLAIDFGFHADQDSIVGHLRTLTSHRDEAFALLHLALTRPRFDAAPLARVRSQVLSIIAEQAGNPESIADRGWWRLMIDGHPYARPIKGRSESLTAITPSDLHRFTAARFGRDRMRIAVVGDIGPKELSILLDRSFAELPAKAAPIDIPEAKPATPGGIAVVERDLDQSVVLFGAPGLKRNDPDFYAAALLDDILGGGNFTSRLQRELREKRGLVYSIDTGLVALDRAGLVSGSLGTKNASVGQAIELVRTAWQKMHDDGPSAAELADAKTHLIGRYALHFVSSMEAAGSLLGIALDGLPIDYMQSRIRHFNAVTPEDARRVARRLYDPSELRFFVLGRPTKLKATLPAPLTD